MSEQFALAGQATSSGECVVIPRADLIERKDDGDAPTTETQES